MSTEFKDFTTTPTLTLDPFAQEAAVPEVVQEAEIVPAEPGWDDSMLNEEEKQMVAAFANQINVKDSNMIMQYGAGAQKKMADFSEKALDNVKTQDLGEVGELLGDVVAQLREFDAEEERGFLGLFKKSTGKLAALKAKYAKAETNINKITENLESHQVLLMKDAATLDKMYELNKTYFKELSMYILAGKKKLQEVRQTDLVAIQQKAQRSGLPEDAQEARDLNEMCNRFEKKLHDLELTRMISLQTAPQIRMVQNNDTLMVEKIQSTLVNTIPLWKSQMVLALGVEHSAQAAAAQRQVSDMTNELLRKNAATLKMATIETAKETERGIVDMETLKQTNESLITTLDEVMRIQQEGRQKRMEAEAEMGRMENELKMKLLQLSAK